VVVDIGAPFVGFWIPGTGSTPMSSWPLRGLHLLERNQLVFIIALGESLLLVGGTLVDSPLTTGYLVAGGLGFLIVVAVWALYFDGQAERAEHAFAQATDPAALARASPAFSHGIMVLGAIVVAVGIELVIAHPWDPIHLDYALTGAIGPIIFLVGNGWYERAWSGSWPTGHTAAIGGLAVVSAVGYLAHVPGVVLGGGILLVLAARWKSLSRLHEHTTVGDNG